MDKLRKYGKRQKQELEHLYWQISRIFDEKRLHGNTRNGHTSFGLTKIISGEPDTTLRRYLFIYDTDEYEEYLKEDAKRVRNYKMRKKMDEMEMEKNIPIIVTARV